MKKIVLASLLLAACGERPSNKAEVMIKAQAAKATCTNYVTRAKDKPDITVCEIPGKTPEDTLTWIGAYGGGRPFRTFPFLTTEQAEKIDAAQKAQIQGAAPAAPTPPPVAGPGSGSAAK